MILEAKNALGRVPSINSDLLNIEGVCFDKGYTENEDVPYMIKNLI